jgi:hypothetical protein
MRARAVELALHEPGEKVRSFRLGKLDDFIGEDADLVILAYYDLHEFECRWPMENILRNAYDRQAPVTDDTMARLERYGIQPLDDLVARWRASPTKGRIPSREPESRPRTYPSASGGS